MAVNAQPLADPNALTWRDWVGFMSMVLGMFMAILDIQIVAASIGEIQAGLSASPDEVAWVQTSYLIAEIVMIPLSGWLSRLLSTRVLFTISALGFTVFSFLCAMSSDLNTMIMCRAMQGFLGGAMIPTVFSASYQMFPASRRAQISVLIGLTATMAPTIGPTLGGWLTQALSWHWLFLINVPVGLLVATSVFTFVHIDRPDHSLRRNFDLFGLVLMAGFLGCLEYVLEDGEKDGWFQDSTIVRLSLIAAVCATLFFWRMLTRRDPLVDLRAFTNVNFAFGSLFSLVIGVGLYGAVYVVPVFLARVRGFDSLEIGRIMFITGLMMFVSAPIAGRLSKVMDLRWMLAMGLVMFGVSVWWLAHLTNQSSFWEMLLPQGLRGFSMMFLFLPVNTLALGTMAPQQLKNASGLYNLMRNLGGAIGLALINTIATQRDAAHVLHLQEQVNWARPGATRFIDNLTHAMTASKGVEAHIAALARVSALVHREALVLSYNDVLLLMAGLFFLAVPLTLLLAKPKAVVTDAH
ncbi:MAG: MFS transporter [Rhodospirillales bacterium 70-18]|nr:DHA2 family efflux MFS transporter permease subunit [Rhodospirillales bacterium]OJY64037.1 MAG: MFS transporter [Rhodospirillales bacterium 70-18]